MTAERGLKPRACCEARGSQEFTWLAGQRSPVPPVILQAARLALLAALSPTALLVGAVYLGSARPRLIGTLYLTGAIVMSLVMGLVVIAILRHVGLSQQSQRTPRYGLRIGLGGLMLTAGAVLARRTPKPPDPAKPRQGIVSRMIANPAPASAFAVGMLLFAPGLAFIAALQVIATARASFELTAVAIVVVVVINAALVWLPLLLHLAAPDITTRHLTAFIAGCGRTGTRSSSPCCW